jgi:hypothetical protein
MTARSQDQQSSPGVKIPFAKPSTSKTSTTGLETRKITGKKSNRFYPQIFSSVKIAIDSIEKAE